MREKVGGGVGGVVGGERDDVIYTFKMLQI